MRIVRVYTGDDQKSHFEQIDLSLKPSRAGRMSRLFAATGILFRETDPGLELDFHVAPRRQFAITLSGRVEIECGDGSKETFGPGDILLADDTTGQGHISRDVGGPRLGIFVPLPDDFDLDDLRG